MPALLQSHLVWSTASLVTGLHKSLWLINCPIDRGFSASGTLCTVPITTAMFSVVHQRQEMVLICSTFCKHVTRGQDGSNPSMFLCRRLLRVHCIALNANPLRDGVKRLLKTAIAPQMTGFLDTTFCFLVMGQCKSSIKIAPKTHLNSKKNKNGRQLELMMVKQAWVSVRFYFF